MPTGHYQRSPRVIRCVFKCWHCGTDIKLTRGYLNAKGEPKFCSHKCQGMSVASKTSRREFNCDYCGKPSIKRMSQWKSNNYCSVNCTAAAKVVVGAKWRDPLKIKEYMRKYHKKNKNAINAARKKWAQDNRTLRLVIQRRYREKNKEKIIATSLHRRRPEAGYVNPEHLAEIRKSADGTCQYCGGVFEKLTIDHIAPLAAGGLNEIGNLIPCCKYCNSSKNTKRVEDWLYEKHGIAGLVRAVWFLEHGETISPELIGNIDNLTVNIVKPERTR